MPQVQAYNGWDQLEEVWLGDVWPKSFYDDLEPTVRDSFYQITDMTREDLDNIQRVLEGLGVKVCRPVIDESRKDLYINPQTGKLYKPPIAVRDLNCVIGNTLYFGETALERCWRPHLDRYDQDPSSTIVKNLLVSGANVVRLGRDIIFDRFLEPGYHFGGMTDQADRNRLLVKDFSVFKNQVIKQFGSDHRVHYTANGGHSDGCFMPIKPGVVLTTRYFEDHDTFFPGWTKVRLDDPTYHAHNTWPTGRPPRWFLPGINGPVFNEYVEQYCPEWIGNYQETFFEVNVLVVNPTTVLCIGTHESLFNSLKEMGINCIVVPFRTRTFWDGGIHCNTLDIRRSGTKEDLFPERGSNGLGIVLTELADNFDKVYAGQLPISTTAKTKVFNFDDENWRENSAPENKKANNSMNIYHIWCDKAEGITDTAWVEKMNQFFSRLVKDNKMVSYRITRCKLGFRSIADLPEWHIMCEFVSLQQLDDCFGTVALKQGQLEDQHKGFNQFVGPNIHHALYRDWPDK